MRRYCSQYWQNGAAKTAPLALALYALDLIDNDRCDVIAVAFSRGGRPALAAPDAAAPPLDEDPAPPALTALLSRLELADRLAEGGFTLSAAELAQLVDLPLARLAERPGDWMWRDWHVRALDPSRWRLERR